MVDRTASQDSLVGEAISHYRIVEKLGGGGMGVVYKAEDVTLGRFVALKFLPDDVARDQQALARFQREAKAASALNHPNICTVYEISDWRGKHFIALELLEGERLKDRVAKCALPVNWVLDFGIQIADALDAAHHKGVIHRDITPTNIYLTRSGQAKLLDFGLAKRVTTKEEALNSSFPTSLGDSALTSPGTTMGTIGYMSPEQVRGQELDARSDIFSYGVVQYEMVTGRQAFPGNTPGVIFDSILNRSPLPLARWNSALPPALEAVVFRALEKDRDLRYQSAAELRADLRRIKRDLESGLPTTHFESSHSLAAPTGSSRHIAAEGLPIVNRQLLRWLIAALQLMYLVFYLVALTRLEEVNRFAQLVIPHSGWGLPAVVLISACIGITVRLYLLSSLVFDHPELGRKFRNLFPLVLVLDELWALSPLFLFMRIGLGLSFAATATLLYCPFSQRTLVRMAYPEVTRAG